VSRAGGNSRVCQAVTAAPPALTHAQLRCCCWRSDPVERLKLVVAFAAGGMRRQVSCDKPFNPILVRTPEAAAAAAAFILMRFVGRERGHTQQSWSLGHTLAVSCARPQGETLQGMYPCGCSVAAEQISHHPPISCWQVRDHAGRVRRSTQLSAQARAHACV
jgi:hypothetical protein